MKREAPEDGENYGWSTFEDFADRVGIGEHPDDWQMDWAVWKAGYRAGLDNK